MSEYAIEMRNQLVGLFGIVERNMYLTKRYFLWDIAFMFWTIANTLTIVFIARAANLPPAKENTLATLLLVGATIWAFLGIIFEFMTETVAWGAGKGRSSTRSWRRCRGSSIPSGRARSRCCTA